MATYYISPTGNDTTGNGSYSTPWLTLSKANTASANGDEIVLKNGTYTSLGSSITRMLNRTIRAETNGQAIITATFSSTILSVELGYTVTVTGLAFESCAVNTWMFDSIYANSTLTLNLCTFSNMTMSSGVYCFRINGAGTINITNCKFYEVNLSGGSFVYCGTQTIYFVNVTFYTSTLSSNSNLFTGSGTFSVKNSIFQNASSPQTLLFKNSGTAAATYSDFYGITSAPTGTGVITSDPLFIYAAGGNLHLRPTSPCLNTGSAV